MGYIIRAHTMADTLRIAKDTVLSSHVMVCESSHMAKLLTSQNTLGRKLPWNVFPAHVAFFLNYSKFGGSQYAHDGHTAKWSPYTQTTCTRIHETFIYWPPIDSLE